MAVIADWLCLSGSLDHTSPDEYVKIAELIDKLATGDEGSQATVQ